MKKDTQPLPIEFEVYSARQLLCFYELSTLNEYSQFRQLDEGKPCFLQEVSEYASALKDLSIAKVNDASNNGGELFV